ncbi:L,D-transpeptidase family protein [Novosphingobium sp. FSY-8]|uniref:L,D-transpeptidase family protein n=2 Tax=Novosphingobium ovatum TaxID=1908523 RepID=A0ABW9XG91_9SPHN|nr:L,D-transpeptidase family protein [Novosphingobium ovatum]
MLAVGHAGMAIAADPPRSAGKADTLGQPAPVRPAPSAVPSVRPVPSVAPSATATARPAPVSSAAASPSPAPSALASPAPAPRAPTMIVVPAPMPVAAWTVGDALSLLEAINTIDREGLIPADYQPAQLRAAIAGGPGTTLDEQASRSFDWLVEDLRDGRTPMPARVQWFAVDPDQDTMPTEQLLMRATTTHDVAGVLASLAPTYPDYAALKAALTNLRPQDVKAREAIRINMDRWRWLPRDLGRTYLIANVPEFMLRLGVNGRNIRTYKVIVGKPGKTATPQLAETVEAVVFNPTWTVPQSIVVGEGLGAKLIGSPASALRQGYKVTRLADGSIQVVQQPGDTNSLGRMKIDMPNPHAIYLHDTPGKHLFAAQVRAFSHGCLRTENALELGMTMAIVSGSLSPDEAVEAYKSLKYKRVIMKRTFPVYISYFTMGVNTQGELTSYGDIYERDAPVLDAFRRPRQLHTTQRASTEEVIKLDNPL